MVFWRKLVDALKHLKFTGNDLGVGTGYCQAIEDNKSLASFTTKSERDLHFEDRLGQEWHQPELKPLDLLKLLHEPAKEGRVGDIKKFLSICPEGVLEVTPTKETALHVAVRHGQDEAVRFLVEWLRETTYFYDVINRQDCIGDTVLHLATSRKQLQTLKLLLEDNPYSGMVEVNAKNNGGFTALDILDVLPEGGEIDMEIDKILLSAGALRSRDLAEEKQFSKSKHEVLVNLGNQWYPTSTQQATKSEVLIRSYPAALIAVTLLATMTFHAALRSPARYYEPSNTFQAETQDSATNNLFLLFNSIAFFTSVAVIIILVHELPIMPWLLILVFSITGAYICSIIAVSPHQILSVLFIGSIILLAALFNCMALHEVVLEVFEWMTTKIHLNYIEMLDP